MNIIEFAKFKKMAGGGSGGGITKVSTAEQMDAILASATDASVGTFYLYNGETTDKYESGALYRIEKE